MAKGIVGAVSSLVAACNNKVTRMRKKLQGQDRESYDSEGTDRRLTPCFSLRGRRRKADDWWEVQRRWKETALMSPFVGHGKTENLWVEDRKWSAALAKKKERGRREDRDGLWRRTILLGEKCRPLDFEGAIHYDGEGRQLSTPPRSPMRSPLPSFLITAAVAGGKR